MDGREERDGGREGLVESMSAKRAVVEKVSTERPAGEG
jgi:hypothetical protein